MPEDEKNLQVFFCVVFFFLFMSAAKNTQDVATERQQHAVFELRANTGLGSVFPLKTNIPNLWRRWNLKLTRYQCLCVRLFVVLAVGGGGVKVLPFDSKTSKLLVNSLLPLNAEIKRRSGLWKKLWSPWRIQNISSYCRVNNDEPTFLQGFNGAYKGPHCPGSTKRRRLN